MLLGVTNGTVNCIDSGGVGGLGNATLMTC